MRRRGDRLRQCRYEAGLRGDPCCTGGPRRHLPGSLPPRGEPDSLGSASPSGRRRHRLRQGVISPAASLRHQLRRALLRSALLRGDLDGDLFCSFGRLYRTFPPGRRGAPRFAPAQGAGWRPARRASWSVDRGLASFGPRRLERAEPFAGRIPPGGRRGRSSAAVAARTLGSGTLAEVQRCRDHDEERPRVRPAPRPGTVISTAAARARPPGGSDHSRGWSALLRHASTPDRPLAARRCRSGG